MDMNQVFTNASNQRYEYLLLRYDYIGRGITGEFHFLDVNGQRLVKNGARSHCQTGLVKKVMCLTAWGKQAGNWSTTAWSMYQKINTLPTTTPSSCAPSKRP